MRRSICSTFEDYLEALDVDGGRRRRVFRWLGIVLVIAGILNIPLPFGPLLLATLSPFEQLWPYAAVGAGVYLILKTTYLYRLDRWRARSKRPLPRKARGIETPDDSIEARVRDDRNSAAS